MASAGDGALEGLLVLDFSTLLPGPLAGLMLAEAGADVVKVERPGGEDMHRFEPRLGETSAPWLILNRGKRVVTADLKSPAALEDLWPLVDSADVVVEQFRPGVMERLGLGYDALASRNPRLVYCSITGYGQTGPRAHEAGHDINYQAVTGLLALAPGTTEAPAVPASLTADIAGGAMSAVTNILLALRQRERTGHGCHLDIAMADAMFTFGWLAHAVGHATGRFPDAAGTLLTGGSPRYGLYATADGRFLAVGALEEKFWLAFAMAIGLPEALRAEGAPAATVRGAVTAIVGSRDAAHWHALLAPLDCCCTVVATLEEALADPHFHQRGLFEGHVEGGGGRLPALPLPLSPHVRRSRQGVTAPRRGPAS
jgi:crotonobetainyl-CoA:carnitine CoA-transferase CaiB-like acyl-CoA transferase